MIWMRNTTRQTTYTFFHMQIITTASLSATSNCYLQQESSRNFSENWFSFPLLHQIFVNHRLSESNKQSFFP